MGVYKVALLWLVLGRHSGRKFALAFKNCFWDSNILKVSREQMEIHLQKHWCFSVLLVITSKFLNPHLGRIHLSIRRGGNQAFWRLKILWISSLNVWPKLWPVPFCTVWLRLGLSFPWGHGWEVPVQSCSCPSFAHPFAMFSLIWFPAGLLPLYYINQMLKQRQHSQTSCWKLEKLTFLLPSWEAHRSSCSCAGWMVMAVPSLH